MRRVKMTFTIDLLDSYLGDIDALADYLKAKLEGLVEGQASPKGTITKFTYKEFTLNTIKRLP